MFDAITLGLLSVGIGGLVLWFASRAAERRAERSRLMKGVRHMADPEDPLEKAVANLPAKLDARDLERRVMDNLAVFQAAPTLLEQFFIKVRNKYSSKWERDVLADVKQLLTQQIEVMELGAQHSGVRQTLAERAETEVFKAKTAHLAAKMEYQDALATSKVSARVAAGSARAKALSAAADTAEQQARRAKAQKETYEARRRSADQQPALKQTREEILENIERDHQFREQKEQAAARGRVNAKLKWRDDMRRERDEKIAVLRNDPTLNEDEKLARIEEIEDAYAQALARGD